jgi:hypothetical protein
MSKLQVIIGSTRPGRAADLVAPWVTSRARGQLPPAAFRIREAAAAVGEVEDEAV